MTCPVLAYAALLPSYAMPGTDLRDNTTRYREELRTTQQRGDVAGDTWDDREEEEEEVEEV
eukprot:3000189-Rhodomonas_salina.1